MTDSVSSRRLKTQQRLLDAAFEVFVKEGFPGATIEMIVEAAGFTRGAFYSNFDSKEQLFVELSRYQFEKRLQRAIEAFDELEDQIFEADSISPSAVGELIASTLSDANSEREWHILYTEFELFALRNPGVDPAVLELNKNYAKAVVEALTPMLASVGLRLAGNPELTVRMVMSAYTSLARGTFLSADLSFDQALAEQMEWFILVLDRMVEPI